MVVELQQQKKNIRKFELTAVAAVLTLFTTELLSLHRCTCISFIMKSENIIFITFNCFLFSSPSLCITAAGFIFSEIMEHSAPNCQ